MTRTLIVAFAAVAALTVSAPAFARETVTTGGGYTQRTVEISPAGYNLDTPRGAERFHDVLARAVRQVCDTGDRTLVARRQQQTCTTETMRAAVAQLDKPFLTAAYGESTGDRIVLAAN
jgi:UrcA family protein